MRASPGRPARTSSASASEVVAARPTAQDGHGHGHQHRHDQARGAPEREGVVAARRRRLRGDQRHGAHQRPEAGGDPGASEPRAAQRSSPRAIALISDENDISDTSKSPNFSWRQNISDGCSGVGTRSMASGDTVPSRIGRLRGLVSSAILSSRFIMVSRQSSFLIFV